VGLTIIAWPEHHIGALRHLRATFIGDSLAEYAAHFALDWSNDASGANPTPAGTNLIVRDVEVWCLKFVEPQSEGVISCQQVRFEQYKYFVTTVARRPGQDAVFESTSAYRRKGSLPACAARSRADARIAVDAAAKAFAKWSEHTGEKARLSPEGGRDR